MNKRDEDVVATNEAKASHYSMQSDLGNLKGQQNPVAGHISTTIYKDY